MRVQPRLLALDDYLLSAYIAAYTYDEPSIIEVEACISMSTIAYNPLGMPEISQNPYNPRIIEDRYDPRGSGVIDEIKYFT